jgi:hypothetical protein
MFENDNRKGTDATGVCKLNPKSGDECKEDSSRVVQEIGEARGSAGMRQARSVEAEISQVALWQTGSRRWGYEEKASE